MSWVRKETGLARVLLRDVGVEATLRVSGPARLGDELMLAHAGTDEVSGGPLFEDVSYRRRRPSDDDGSGGRGGGTVEVAAVAAIAAEDDGDDDEEIDVVEEEEEQALVDDVDEDASSAVVSDGVDAEK